MNTPLNLDAELARLAKAQAEDREMRNAMARGDLVPCQQAHLAVATGIERVRVRVLELFSEIAPNLASAETVAEAEAMLTDAIQEALEELDPNDGPQAA
jgi:hypothetical protein